MLDFDNSVDKKTEKQLKRIAKFLGIPEESRDDLIGLALNIAQTSTTKNMEGGVYNGISEDGD